MRPLAVVLAVLPGVLPVLGAPSAARASPAVEAGLGAGYGMDASFSDCGTGTGGGGGGLWVAVSGENLPWLGLRAGVGAAHFADGEPGSGPAADERGGTLAGASLGLQAVARLERFVLGVSAGAAAARACADACDRMQGLGAELGLRAGVRLDDRWEIGPYLALTLFDTQPEIGEWSILGLEVVLRR